MGALFSILGDVNGRSFLDLFAGTGKVARYARDRGACPVTAVELIPARARAIRALFPGDRNVTVLTMDVRRATGYLRKKACLFDIVFADPPYEAGWLAEMGPLLFSSGGGIVAPGGVAAVEHSYREEPAPGPDWTILESRRYGDGALTFFVPREEEEK